MESMLKVRDLWGFIDGKETKLEEIITIVLLAAYEKKERCTVNVWSADYSKFVKVWLFKMLIIQTMSNNQLLIMQKESIAKGIWDVLQMQHVDKGLTNRLFLTWKFFNSQLALGDSMEEHLSKLGAIVKELDVIGATIPKEVKVMVPLMGLPQSYEYLVTFLESLKSFDLKKLTWEAIATRLLNEKLMKKEKNKSLDIMSIDTTLLSKKTSTQRHKDKSEDVCNYCKQKWHCARKCKKKKNEYVKTKIEQGNTTESND